MLHSWTAAQEKGFKSPAGLESDARDDVLLKNTETTDLLKKCEEDEG